MKKSLYEDYVGTFNGLAEVTLGSAARSELIMAAAILTAFKRLVDWVIVHSASSSCQPQINPFDWTGNRDKAAVTAPDDADTVTVPLG